MIYGIGTDIVKIERMAALYARHGERALEHLLAPNEYAHFQCAVRPERYLAKRFAAKEALAKALGTGLRAPVLLTAMGVVNDELGKPAFEFSQTLALWLRERGLRCHLSLSDERDNALAFVVVEQS